MVGGCEEGRQGRGMGRGRAGQGDRERERERDIYFSRSILGNMNTSDLYKRYPCTT